MSAPSHRAIVIAAFEALGLSASDIRRRSTRPAIVQARRAAVHALRALDNPPSTKEIARLVGLSVWAVHDTARKAVRVVAPARPILVPTWVPDPADYRRIARLHGEHVAAREARATR